jgi:hypothetical protein
VRPCGRDQAISWGHRNIEIQCDASQITTICSTGICRRASNKPNRKRSAQIVSRTAFFFSTKVMTRKRYKSSGLGWFWLLCVSVAFSTPNYSQEDAIRVDTNLVAVPVTVFDRDGRYLTDLKKENFQLFENGCPDHDYCSTGNLPPCF